MTEPQHGVKQQL